MQQQRFWNHRRFLSSSVFLLRETRNNFLLFLSQMCLFLPLFCNMNSWGIKTFFLCQMFLWILLPNVSFLSPLMHNILRTLKIPKCHSKVPRVLYHNSWQRVSVPRIENWRRFYLENSSSVWDFKATKSKFTSVPKSYVTPRRQKNFKSRKRNVNDNFN